MIKLYEPVEYEKRLLRPFEWIYDPDADTILLVYDPYHPSGDSIHIGLLIDGALERGYLDRMYLPSDVEEWLPER